MTVDGYHLRFSATVQTDPACTSELELVDDMMLTILDGDVEFDIEADRLELRRASSAGLGCTRTSEPELTDATTRPDADGHGSTLA